jgi:hypothetical protein
MKLLKDLFLALLNATVLLILLALIAGIMLTRQVDQLADQVHDDLAPQAARLERIADGIEGIEAELAADVTDADMVALAADVAALRLELADATAKLGAVSDITAQGLMESLGQAVAGRMAAPAP